MQSDNRREGIMDLLECGELAVKSALKLGADEAEAFLTRGREIDVKAEANELKLATSHAKDGIGIRVFSDRGLGFASVNIAGRAGDQGSSPGSRKPEQGLSS
jgi:predicted Zn-dependent protease